LFVAAYPPADVARALLMMLQECGLPAHRASRVEQVHMTLQFIGDTRLSDVDEVGESMARSASGVGHLEVLPRRIISLPDRGPARLVAAETDRPPLLLELHRRLARRLARRPGEHEGFLPHMTLARFSGPVKGLKVVSPVRLPSFIFADVRLMQSDLGPSEAVHRLVRAVVL